MTVIIVRLFHDLAKISKQTSGYMTLHTQYFPSTIWMQSLLQQENVLIEQWENYQKQGLRNRCKILGAEAIITLGVPLAGGREQKTLVRDIRINHAENWQLSHLKSIRSCYSKSPFFDYYYPEIETVLSMKLNYLLDLNQQIAYKLKSWFRWEGSLELTSEFMHVPLAFEPPDAQVLTPYFQVFSDRKPFVPGLSVLDLLFCTGPSAKKILLA